jgi:hypothetical protein
VLETRGSWIARWMECPTLPGRRGLWIGAVLSGESRVVPWRLEVWGDDAAWWESCPLMKRVAACGGRRASSGGGGGVRLREEQSKRMEQMNQRMLVHCVEGVGGRVLGVVGGEGRMCYPG